MKKLMMLVMAMVMGLTLVACSNAPDGMREEFHKSAVEVFAEIDDDTMELEKPDLDDVANYQAVVADAESDRELEVAKNLEIIVTYNPDIIKPNANQADFAPYITARKNLAKLLDIEVPQFKIVEGQTKN